MSNRPQTKKKLFIRIAAWVLAALMLGGTVFAAIYSAILSSSAADYNSYSFSSDQKNHKYIACGLMYGNGVTVGFETTTTNGFVIGSANISDIRSYEAFWSTPVTKVSITSDANLSKTAMTYSITEGNDVVIGGYHAELPVYYNSIPEVELWIMTYASALESAGYYAFPAYINGMFRIRIGHFASEETAAEAIAAISEAIDGQSLNVAAPSAYGVSLVNPVTDEILFEYSNGDRYYLGLAPIQSGSTEAYIKTPANNIYGGVFCYGRYKTGSTDGVTVINLLPLEEYIMGVLPWEISSSWPMEIQKAFAVTTRSFSIANMKRHYNAYGFDLCNSTHCQAYLGLGRTNDNVRKAVSSTENMVLQYDNKVVSAFYTSTMGGESILSSDAWGGTNPGYIVSQSTPWEDYTNDTFGLWTAEVSPSELASYLIYTRGLSNLKSDIANLRIDAFAGNTGYVKTLSIIDSLGNSVSITNTDSVRSNLTKYVKSANFVVGRGSVERTYARLINVTITDNSGTYKPPTVTPPTVPEPTNTDLLLFNQYVMSGYLGLVRNESPMTSTINANGYQSLMSTTILTADGYAVGNKLIIVDGFGNSSYRTTISTVNGPITVSAEVEIVTETVYASDPNNFIFAGKGWGHGVGLSQSGAKKLAEMGLAATTILQAYFHGATVVDFHRLP